LADLRNDTSYMYKYLQYVVQFEKYVYIWTNAMNSANRELQSVYDKRDRYDSAVQESISNRNSFNAEFKQNKAAKNKYFKIFFFIALFITLNLIIIGVTAFTGHVPGIFVSIGRALGNEVDTAEIQRNIMGLSGIFCGYALLAALFFFRKYRKNKRKVSSMKKTGLIRSSESLIDNKKRAAQEYRLTSADEENRIKKKQNEIFSELTKAKKNLADVYSNNALPNKYRSFVAAATLLGYLETGRCTIIMGHGGIYDTYERDVQMNMIITRLDEIRDTALRIEANQQILIREVQKANSILNSINSTVNRIDATTKRIERNTAISAVANQQTAAAASYMAWNMI